MSKQISWALVACVGLGATTVGAFSDKAPKKKIVIKGCQKKKKPVIFDHVKHVKAVKKDCTACHHKVDNKPPKKNRCSQCHLKKQGKKLDTCQAKSPKKNPFHRQCIGCHKKNKATAPKAPTKCKQCHPKK